MDKGHTYKADCPYNLDLTNIVFEDEFSRPFSQYKQHHIHTYVCFRCGPFNRYNNYVTAHMASSYNRIIKHFPNFGSKLREVYVSRFRASFSKRNFYPPLLFVKNRTLEKLCFES